MKSDRDKNNHPAREKAGSWKQAKKRTDRLSPVSIVAGLFLCQVHSGCNGVRVVISPCKPISSSKEKGKKALWVQPKRALARPSQPVTASHSVLLNPVTNFPLGRTGTSSQLSRGKEREQVGRK